MLAPRNSNLEKDSEVQSKDPSTVSQVIEYASLTVISVLAVLQMGRDKNLGARVLQQAISIEEPNKCVFEVVLKLLAFIGISLSSSLCLAGRVDALKAMNRVFVDSSIMDPVSDYDDAYHYENGSNHTQ